MRDAFWFSRGARGVEDDERIFRGSWYKTVAEEQAVVIRGCIPIVESRRTCHFSCLRGDPFQVFLNPKATAMAGLRVDVCGFPFQSHHESDRGHLRDRFPGD